MLFDGSYLKGETPYSCNLCGKTFAFQQSFHKHMLYHTDEKPYTCTWKDCGKAFKELSTLQNHERIHSGERPFVCETCNKSFRQRVSYLVHRRWVLYNNFEVKDNFYLEMESQDSHWGAAIHLYCLWQEIPIQGLKK